MSLRRRAPAHTMAQHLPPWSSGQDACLSRRRSPVRIRLGVLVLCLQIVQDLATLAARCCNEGEAGNDRGQRSGGCFLRARDAHRVCKQEVSGSIPAGSISRKACYSPHSDSEWFMDAEPGRRLVISFGHQTPCRAKRHLGSRGIAGSRCPQPGHLLPLLRSAMRACHSWQALQRHQSFWSDRAHYASSQHLGHTGRRRGKRPLVGGSDYRPGSAAPGCPVKLS